MIGALLTTKGLYLGGKAIVAQILLDRAWASGLQSGDPTSPWGWMDTVPIAKIIVPATKW